MAGFVEGLLVAGAVSAALFTGWLDARSSEAASLLVYLAWPLAALRVGWAFARGRPSRAAGLLAGGALGVLGALALALAAVKAGKLRFSIW